MSGARTGGTVPPCASSGSKAEVKPSSEAPISASVRPRSGVPFGRTDAVDELEVADVDLEQQRRVGQDLLAQRVGRPLDGAAGRVRDHAPATDRGARRGGGVGADHRDVVGGDAQPFGGDRGEAGRRARDVDHAGHDRHPAVGLETADRRGRLAATRPRPGGQPDPLAVREGRPVAVERMVGEPGQAFVEADAAPRRPVGHLVVGGDEVAAAELDRVDLEAPGQLVDQLLEGEGGLRRSRRAVGAGGDPVGLDAVGHDLVRVPVVRTDGQDGRDALDAVLAEAAGLEAEPGAQATETTVARRTRARPRGSRPGPGWSSGSPRAGSARRGPAGAGPGWPPRPAGR